MKNNKGVRINEFVFENAKEIVRKSYDNDMTLLPSIIKCAFHDGIMQCLDTSGMLQYMVFHGGTSLQRIFGSNRLSEDLDFCMRYGISEVNEFKIFCKKFEETLKNDFAKMYMIDESDIFFREPDSYMSIVRDGDVFTWKIGIVVSLGEKRQIIKIDLENREPLTSKMQFFGRLAGDSIQHNDIYLNVETKEEMLVNKFISLFQRNRLQYRDFYDIGFLSKLNGNTIDETLLFKKIRRKFSDEQFMDKLDRRKNIFDDMEMFTSSFRYELERFIPKHLAVISLSDQMIEYTKNMVDRYVNTYCKQRMHEVTECDDESFRMKP